MYGVLLHQTYNYFRVHSADSSWTKFYVSSVWAVYAAAGLTPHYTVTGRGHPVRTAIVLVLHCERMGDSRLQVAGFRAFSRDHVSLVRGGGLRFARMDADAWAGAT